jgi:hypothetical protein
MTVIRGGKKAKAPQIRDSIITATPDTAPAGFRVQEACQQTVGALLLSRLTQEIRPEKAFNTLLVVTAASTP